MIRYESSGRIVKTAPAVISAIAMMTRFARPALGMRPGAGVIPAAYVGPLGGLRRIRDSGRPPAAIPDPGVRLAQVGS